ncbi:hypothetical protein TNCV_535411 [Trichonephila clavipes]|nr:hypothetical protein TNCV_535411 [Trichonephila clavipes]
MGFPQLMKFYLLYYLSKSSIDWHLFHPSSPHFGGIWESEFDPSPSEESDVLSVPEELNTSQPPTTEIAPSCHRTSNGLEEVSSEFIPPYNPQEMAGCTTKLLKEDDTSWLIKEEGPRYMANGRVLRRIQATTDCLCCNCETQDSVFKRLFINPHKLPTYPTSSI